MEARTSAAATSDERELVITRVFDAPRRLVFKAWTELEHVSEWQAPEGFIVVSLEMDVRPGGTWRKCMRAPDGKEYWRHGVYREVVEPERLVFTYVTDDPLTSTAQESLVTVTLADLGAKTRMTFRQAGFESVASRKSHEGGWSSALQRLVRHLAAERLNEGHR